MTRARILCVVLLFAAASCASVLAQRPAAAKNSHPDVFLITIDTLRADHLHCYGYQYPQTPALDQLAEDGTRFTEAFTPSPITNVSHTSILTGLLPISHGVSSFGVPLTPAYSTLAEMLKAGGYKTAAFIGAVVLDSKSLAPGLDRGFDFYDNFPEHQPATASRWGRLERRGKDVVAHAEKWLDTHRAGPRLVWVHLYDPHDPYEPPPPYAQQYRDRPYDGEIAYADSAFGDFVAYLRKQGWYDSALVIVVGDHGEGLGEHNEATHGIFLYDSTTHVPLIVKQPGKQTGNQSVTAQVRTTDIVPTVLDLLGVPVPAQFDGESLKAYLSARGDNDVRGARTAFGETDYPLSFGWAPLRCVRAAGFKFIEAPRPELYDLRADPGELHSVYEPWNPQVQTLRAELAALREKHPPGTNTSAGAVGTGTTEELQALGYLGPADARSSSTVAEPSLLPDPKDKIAEQNFLHEAMLAVDAARPADARASLEKVLALDPKSSAALVQLGQVEYSAANYSKAAEYFNRATEIRPDDANISLKQGEALSKTGDLAGAEKALQHALQSNPNQYAARVLLGSVFLHLHNFSAAQDQLEAALLSRNSFEVELRLGEVLVAQQKFVEGRDQLAAAIKLEPNSAEAYELLARAYTGLHKLQEAQAAETHAKMLRSRRARPQNEN